MDTMCFININDNIIGNSLEVVDPEGEHSDDYEDYEELLVSKPQLHGLKYVYWT